MNFITEYKIMSSLEIGENFIGMNTPDGFVGGYNDIISEKDLNRVYIIKGAAGTGKSSFLKKIVSMADSKGINCQRYACGSDYKSLDCVVLDSKIAVLDGTNPHPLEMKYPGASSEIIDLTKFWDDKYLISKRDKIISNSNKKREMYNRAYSVMRTISAIIRERLEVIGSALDKEKISECSEKIVRSFGKSNGCGKETDSILRSVGISGMFRLDTFERKASKIISVSDTYGSAYLLMSTLREKLLKEKFDIITSYDPIITDRVCDIYVPIRQTLITVEDSETSSKVINMNRFVYNDLLKKVRGTLRLSKKCEESLLQDVLRYLFEAGEYHFALENIYGSAMNFDCLSSYFDIKCKEIFDSI